MADRKPDCVETFAAALTRDQRAGLTGFSGRAFAALAHLREAWCVADPNNCAAVEAGIRELLKGHTLERHREIVVVVLVYGLASDQAAQLLNAVGFKADVLPAGGV